MKDLISFVLPVTFLCFFTGCDILGGNEDSSLKELLVPQNELIPLEVGNYWVYEQWFLDPSNKDTVREEVIGTRQIIAEDIIVNAFETVRFRYDTRPTDDALFSLKANGIDGHFFLGGWAKVDSLYINNRRYKYPAEVGETWESRQILFDTDIKEYKIGNTRTIELIDTNRTITTSAGVFENCYVYKHQDYNPLFPYFQFVFIKPGIGIVGGETIASNDTTDLAGQYFLMEYKIE